MSSPMHNRHKLRRSLTCTLAAAALSGGAIASSAPAAIATGPVEPLVECGYADDHSTSGAKAYWQLSCSGGNVTVSGWVEDTSSNGRCAKVKAQFPDGTWKFSEAACPAGDRESFSWTLPGSSAKVYLYEYNV